MAAPMLAPVFDRKRSSSGICKPKTASKLGVLRFTNGNAAALKRAIAEAKKAGTDADLPWVDAYGSRKRDNAISMEQWVNGAVAHYAKHGGQKVIPRPIVEYMCDHYDDAWVYEKYPKVCVAKLDINEWLYATESAHGKTSLRARRIASATVDGVFMQTKAGIPVPAEYLDDGADCTDE